jgi:hypothetical protein
LDGHQLAATIRELKRGSYLTLIDPPGILMFVDGNHFSPVANTEQREEEIE